MLQTSNYFNKKLIGKMIGYAISKNKVKIRLTKERFKLDIESYNSVLIYQEYKLSYFPE